MRQPITVRDCRLAKEIGVPARRVNEIVPGQRRISADTALRLARFFGTSERFWINLQSRYDLEMEKDCGRRQGTGPLPPPTRSYLLSSARASPDGRMCVSAAVVRRPRCGPVLGVCRGEHLVLLGGGRIPEVGGVASRCDPGGVAELVEAVVATSVHDLGVVAALPGDDAFLERAARRGWLCRCVLDGRRFRWRQ